MRRRRAIFGFLLAPMAPSMVFAIGATVIGSIGSLLGVSLYSYLLVCLIWFLYAIVVAYSTSVIIGIPSYFIYKKYGLTSLRAYIVGGISLGTLFPFLLMPIFGMHEVLRLELWVFLAGSAFGFVTSTLFWYVSIRNPTHQLDKDILVK
jgi:hypothetical protein